MLLLVLAVVPIERRPGKRDAEPGKMQEEPQVAPMAEYDVRVAGKL
jgi:hypothetical protein